MQHRVRFHFEIGVTEVGANDYAARVTSLARRDRGSGHADKLPLPPIAEQHGATEAEARQKLNAAMEAWINGQFEQRASA